MKGCVPMKISQEEIKNIALLSRLEVKEEHMAHVEKELSDILTYVAELNALGPDTSGGKYTTGSNFAGSSTGRTLVFASAFF